MSWLQTFLFPEMKIFEKKGLPKPIQNNERKEL